MTEQTFGLIVELLDELSPHARTDHMTLTVKALTMLGLSRVEIVLFLKGELLLD